VSAEENKALIRRWGELWNAGDAAAIAALVTPDYVRHDPNGPEVRGPDAERQLVELYRAAFPDLRFTIEHLVAEGDLVVAHLTVRGTHRGELLGIPPTGTPITLAAMELYRIRDGKVAEQWVALDALGLLQQLGAVPTPGQADG
jgi:steroid delta-isomerase-like uncharacterized protein